MKALKQLLYKWVLEAGREEEGKAGINMTAKGPSRNDNGMHLKNPMHITLYNVTGGTVVKFTRNDDDGRLRDSSGWDYENSYIITKDDNFEKALAQFISLEALKHVR